MEKDFFELVDTIIEQFENMQKKIYRLYGYGSSLKYYEYLKKSVYGSFKNIVGASNIDIPQSDLNDMQPNIMQNRMKNVVKYDLLKEVGLKLSETVNALGVTQKEQIQKLSEIDFGSMFYKKFVDSASFKESIDIAYDIVQEELDEVDRKSNIFKSDFSSAKELEETVKEHINNFTSFQEKLSEWTEKKKKRYFIYFMILYFLWGNFCQPYFQQNIGIPATAYVVSNVKERPQKRAKIICQLKENVKAIILESLIYYYKVSFTDEDGNAREGYVSKINLKLLKNEDKERE